MDKFKLNMRTLRANLEIERIHEYYQMVMYVTLLSRPTPNHNTHIIFVTFTEIYITRVSQNRFKYAAAIIMNLTDFSAKKRPKEDHFYEKVFFKDQSLLKKTELGALIF